MPAGSPFGPLDQRFAALAADNRWNEPGQPAFYFAGDRGVVIAEYGRHAREERSPDMASETAAREIFRVPIAVERTIDLREPDVLRALSLESVAPICFLDRPRARATVVYLLAHTSAEALVVPSMAFLDAPQRWNLVVYLERIDAAQVFGNPKHEETLLLRPADTSYHDPS